MRTLATRRRPAQVFLLAWIAVAPTAVRAAYGPLVVQGQPQAVDVGRGPRPPTDHPGAGVRAGGSSPMPVVLFGVGLGGTRGFLSLSNKRNQAKLLQFLRIGLEKFHIPVRFKVHRLK